MTYCSEEDFTVMQYNTAYTYNDDKWENGALKAYYVKNSVDDVNTENGKVYLTQITGESKIPGWSETEDFGVFFRGEANQSYSIFYPYDKMSTTLTMAGTTNCLKGVVTDTRITIPDPEDPEEEFSYFIFSKSTGNFRRITSSGTCKANKAYIKIKDGGNPSMGTEESKELAISFPEETGIATLETKSVQNDAWYTLQGVQVNQPQKGVFIKNGKKYIVKQAPPLPSPREGMGKGIITEKRNIMMKKNYITPEMIVRRVILDGFIADSENLDNNPYTGDDWGDDQGAKKGGDSWTNPSNDIWED